MRESACGQRVLIGGDTHADDKKEGREAVVPEGHPIPIPVQSDRAILAIFRECMEHYTLVRLSLGIPTRSSLRFLLNDQINWIQIVLLTSVC